MSLRSETFRAYRALFRSVQIAARQTTVSNKEGLITYVSKRFHERCEANRQMLSVALSDLDATLGTVGRGERRSAAKRRRQVMQQFERYLSQSIDQSRHISQVLYTASDSAELTSILQVLAAGVGNQAYKDHMEINFIAMAQHEARKEARHEQTEEETSERQNRILQMAVLPYAEKLLLAHRAALSAPSMPAPSLRSATDDYCDIPRPTHLSSWQMSEAMVGSRVGVTAHRITLGHDQAVIEVDETYNKQVIYVVCRRPTLHPDAEGSNPNTMSIEDAQSTDGFSWEEDLERVGIAESDEVTRTVFASSYLSRAARLCDALERETPLHRSRKTVIVGHGVGGAVGLIVSLILLHRGFEITNVITLGAPKSLQGTLERHIAAINPIRVVLGGDPLIDYPVTGAEGQPFVHIGEILLLSPAGGGVGKDSTGDSTINKNSREAKELLRGQTSGSQDLEQQEEDVANEKDEEIKIAHLRQRYRKQFLIEHYAHHLSNPTVPLTYAEGDEVWDDGDYNAMKKKGQV